MHRLIDAGRYADYHAYNYLQAGRDWSRHAHNIVAGFGPDAAFARAYLRSLFEGRMSEGERMAISTAIAESDLDLIEEKDLLIPTDAESVRNEVSKVIVETFNLPGESWPGKEASEPDLPILALPTSVANQLLQRDN